MILGRQFGVKIHRFLQELAADKHQCVSFFGLEEDHLCKSKHYIINISIMQ